MRQQGIDKREQTIDRIQRRATIAPGKGEFLPILQNQTVEHAKIGAGRLPFHPSGLIQTQRTAQLLGTGFQHLQSLPHARGVHPLTVVPQAAAQHRPRIGHLARQHGPRHPGHARRVVGLAVLSLAQAHIALLRPAHHGQKAAVLRQKRNSQPLFSAMPQQKRAAQHIAKADNAVQHMQREAPRSPVLAPHQHTLPILGKIRALSSDIEGIEQLFHDKSPRNK